MLKRPSSRRKGNREQIALNLVPVLDAMVTLIGFMLFTMSFLALVSIESPFPEASDSVQEQKLKERPLQLTVSVRDDETEVWSPFEKFEPRKVPHLSPGQPDIPGVHAALVAIKQQFLNETKAVFVPNSGVTYDTMIAMMDSIRMLDKTDPPVYRKNPATGVDEALRTLFPEIIFGNLLGDT
jgi:biopolymer transport protein ExbD